MTSLGQVFYLILFHEKDPSKAHKSQLLNQIWVLAVPESRSWAGQNDPVQHLAINGTKAQGKDLNLPESESGKFGREFLCRLGCRTARETWNVLKSPKVGDSITSRGSHMFLVLVSRVSLVLLCQIACHLLHKRLRKALSYPAPLLSLHPAVHQWWQTLPSEIDQLKKRVKTAAIASNL